MDEMQEILNEFLVECGEGLDSLDRDLVELEKDPTSSDLLARIFRSVHTLKGTSGVLGFTKLAAISHVGENLLSQLRDGSLLLNPAITSALLAMVDATRNVLAQIAKDGQEGDQDYSEVIAQLSSLALPSEAASPQTRPEVEMASAEAESKSDAKEPPCSAKGSNPPAAAVSPAVPQPEQRTADLSNNSIRVDVNQLDKLMNLVGELVLARNQILQFTTSQLDSALLATAQRLNLITTELQEGVMKTRMQPIGNIWNKFPRIVRDMAKTCGKNVELEMEGAETELDKTIIEAIKDPLTHILRNSLDHGIELPEKRRELGKSAQGHLHLRAFHEGGQVNIEISDDGSGVDSAAVKAKAIERGLLTAEKALRMSEREILNFIFLPGFSTAKTVTNISGRGVGMDVVKTNIEKIGGTIDLQSVPGEGTTLKIKIPLTLAIIPALMVTSGNERFAIPQVNLVELVRLEGDQVHENIDNIHGAPVYRLRGNLLPLVLINQQLDLVQRSRAEGEPMNIVVLQADGRQFGLVVDDINDTEEIVVKPLSKQLKRIKCFAGATIMGDGKVALILDVLGLAQIARLVKEVADRDRVETDSTSQNISSRESWLLFRAGGKGRMAIRLALVSRLEEFPTSMVEYSGSQQVVQYRGQIMPLIRVSQALNVDAPQEQGDVLQAIVYAQNGKSVGLVVDEILDIVEQHVEVEHAREDGEYLGSAVLQQKVTDLLNVEALTQQMGTADRRLRA